MEKQGKNAKKYSVYFSVYAIYFEKVIDYNEKKEVRE